MVAYETGDFWGVYRLPVPYRKWMIQRYNKWVKEQNSKTPQPQGRSSKALPATPPTDRPLNASERAKMINASKGVQPESNNAMNAFTHGVTSKK